MLTFSRFGRPSCEACRFSVSKLLVRAAGPRKCPRGSMASWAEQLQHELSGRGLAVASIPGKDRGLVATPSFSPGEVIVCQEPYASTPNKVSVASSCGHCFASGDLRKGSVCRVARYCGSACQKEEWELHQLRVK